MGFPVKLHHILENEDNSIISWIRNGVAFKVFDIARFQDYILPKYYRHGKLESFQKQLNLYGFKRINKGEDIGAYSHPLFIQSKRELARKMKRVTKDRVDMLEILPKGFIEAKSPATNKSELDIVDSNSVGSPSTVLRGTSESNIQYEQYPLIKRPSFNEQHRLPRTDSIDKISVPLSVPHLGISRLDSFDTMFTFNNRYSTDSMDSSGDELVDEDLILLI